MIKRFLQKINPYLFVIVVIAAILRLSNLTLDPPSLNWDEVSHGYNAYSILTTGKDEWGVRFPVIFRAFGDYKLPIYIYVTALLEKFVGLNELAVRLPSALAGIGTVIFTYPLVLELFKKKSLALISAFLVAVEPWSLFLSRGAFEANLSLFFLVGGVYFFLRSLEKPRSFLLFSLFMGLSVWTYNSARVFVPILIAILAAIYWKEFLASFRRGKKTFILSFIVLAFFFIPMFIQLLQPVGQARYGKVSIINDGAIAKIEEARNNSKLPDTLNRLINNRVTYFTQTFINNWASHYSGSFLFFNGGSDYQFSVPGRGIIYWIDIIPITVGLIFLIIKRSKAGILILAWFLLSPIPSALTNEAPQVLRTIVMLPVPMILAAVGIEEIAAWLKAKTKVSTKIVLAAYVILIYLFLENYGTAYATTYRTNYSWSWQYGYKQVVEYAKAHYGDYDKIIITKKYGEPHEYFLFYWPWDPAKFLKESQDNTTQSVIRFYQSGWYWVDKIDNLYFINDWNITGAKSAEGFMDDFQLEYKDQGSPVFIQCGYVTDLPKEHKVIREGGSCLLITSPGNVPSNKWKKLETINFLDGKPAFEIYAIKPITYEKYIELTKQ